MIEIVSQQQNCGIRLEFEVSEDEKPQCLGGTLIFYVINISRGDLLKKEITRSFDIVGPSHTLNTGAVSGEIGCLRQFSSRLS